MPTSFDVSIPAKKQGSRFFKDKRKIIFKPLVNSVHKSR